MLGRSLTWTLFLGLSLAAGTARASALRVGICQLQGSGGDPAHSVDAALAAHADAWPGVGTAVRIELKVPRAA